MLCVGAWEEQYRLICQGTSDDWSFHKVQVGQPVVSKKYGLGTKKSWSIYDTTDAISRRLDESLNFQHGWELLRNPESIFVVDTK